MTEANDTGLPSDVQASLSLRILMEQAETLMAASRRLPVGNSLVTVTFWLIFYIQSPQPSLLVWALLAHLMQIQRVVFVRRYLKTPVALREPVRSANWHCASLALSACGWGLAPWLFFPTNDPLLASLMMLFLLGISASSVATMATYRPAVYCFGVPIIAGLASALLWQGTGLYAALALCMLAFLHANLRDGRQQNKLIADALRARYENADLAQRLTGQVLAVEKASLEKTRFFASASHDLRQPLHSLGLFGTAIASRLKGSPDELLASNLMLCVDALETSFTAMLDVSKLDAGVVRIEPAPTALVDVFRTVAATFGQQAECRGLTLRFKPHGKWVIADATQLTRLLGNLVHNALKFTSRGGVVVVARTSGSQVSLQVWDSGIGISAAELPMVFDEFYQVGNRERQRARGLGMGLAIVRRLAALMEMPLQVQSRQGRGTVFKLRMPRCEASDLPLNLNPQLSSSLSSMALRALTGRCVLVVDDEETVRSSTAAALRLYGLRVEVADGLVQARAITTQLGDELDGLITDFRLHNEEDGISLVANLRTLLGRPLPVLLITGDTAPQRVRQAQASGLSVLYKPVKAHDLVDALRMELARTH